MRLHRLTLAAFFIAVIASSGLVVVVAAAADEDAGPKGKPASAPAWEPTDAYEVRKVEGWTIRFNKKLLADEPELSADVMDLMKLHLLQVKRTVPKAAVEKLQAVVIWVERDDPKVVGMCYHPDPGWLTRNGLNPEKAGCIEVGNAKNFLGWWHDQPWMVLHELAHAYHHRFLLRGFDNPEIKSAYERAKQAKLYDNVQRINGKDEKAYAMNDPMEFFAECSEAYFGTNDFYPFVRSELKKHDPETWEALGKAWGVGR